MNSNKYKFDNLVLFFKKDPIVWKELALVSLALIFFVLGWNIINIFFALFVIGLLLFGSDHRMVAGFSVFLIFFAAIFSAFGMVQKTEIFINYAFVLIWASLLIYFYGFFKKIFVKNKESSG